MSDPDAPTGIDGEPWQEAAEQTKLPVMLALFDVLGFSLRLREEGIEKVLARYNDMIETTIRKVEERREWQSGFVPTGDGSSARIPVLFPLNVRFAYFSDTILLWVPLERMFVTPFVRHCATFVCEALAMRVPVRGALALGEAVMHRQTSTFIGQPLIDAARLEHAQKWIGVAFAHSATWPNFLAELDPRLIIEYDAPSKDDAKGNLTPVVLDWPRRWRELHEASPVDALEEMNQASPHEYYRNTIPFVRHSAENQDWHLRSDEQMKDARLRMTRPANTGLEPAAPS